MFLELAQHKLDLSQTHIMGVLNVTPDSFSDGGKFNSLDNAIRRAEVMLNEGAAILDVGGESTRPGAVPVSEQEELDRVCPVVERLVKELDALVSVDTSTPKVMAEAITLGAGMINDVRAFQREGAVEAVKSANVALCLMHMQGQPKNMQDAPAYESVVDDVGAFFGERISELRLAGVRAERVVLDPGFGFGKTLEHNLSLLASLEDMMGLGYPLLVGMSRKSMIGALLNKDVDERLIGSVVCATVAAYQGASIVRVHDVAETADAMIIVNALKASKVR